MKVTLMADISLRANVGCEKSTCVLEIRDAHLRCLSCERYSRALSKQLNDATSDAGCQIEHVVDCDCVVDYFHRLKSQLNAPGQVFDYQALVLVGAGKTSTVMDLCGN
jgi:hypothetical protein